MSRKPETEHSFRSRMNTIRVPDGFRAKFAKSEWGDFLTFVLLKEDDTKLVFDHSAYGSGHTSFSVGGGWRSFDRTGVEDSFHHVDYNGRKLDKYGLNALVNEQLKRIANRREYYKTAVTIPGLPGGYTIAPEGVVDLKNRLQQFGHISFTPPGFGTGYCVTKKPQWGLQFGETRAKPELEAFLGHKPLFVHTLDCD